MPFSNCHSDLVPPFQCDLLKDLQGAAWRLATADLVNRSGKSSLLTSLCYANGACMDLLTLVCFELDFSSPTS